jgi:cytochrome P450
MLEFVTQDAKQGMGMVHKRYVSPPPEGGAGGSPGQASEGPAGAGEEPLAVGVPGVLVRARDDGLSRSPEKSGDGSLLRCLAAHSNDVDAYYRAVHELAGEARAFWDEPLKAWIITGYEECAGLMVDPRLARARLSLPRNPEAPQIVDFAQRVLDAQTMFSDDPGAAAIRKQWGQLLSEGLDGAEESSLATLALTSLDAAVSAGSEAAIDLFADVLEPYVSRVICGRLSLDERERSQLYPHIARYVQLLDGKFSRPGDIDAALYSIVSLYGRLAGKCKAPGASAGDRHRWISNYILALVAGHESAAYLIGTALLFSPEICQGVAALDRRRLGHVVLEALRYDSPIQLMGRRVVEDLSINGRALQAGDRVFLHIAAANRDPRVFRRPDAFDPERSDPPPLSFGLGASQCIGRGLAVRQSVVFLSTAVEQGYPIAIDRARVERNNGLAGRGFRALPARVWRRQGAWGQRRSA